MPWNNELIRNLFAGAGEVPQLLNAFPWDESPLGHPATWPTSLRVLVRQILDAQFPMWLAWGPQLSVFYNDGCIPIMGEKHPKLLGSPLEVVWAEVWNQIKPLAQKALEGASVFSENEPYSILRGGRMERAWFTYSLTPGRNDCGAIEGIFCVLTETTAQAKAEEDLRKLNETLELEVATKTFERDRLWVNSQDLLLVADHQGIYRDVNPAWTTVLGYDRKELIGRYFVDLVHPEDRDGLLQAHYQAIEKPLHGAEARFQHKDGSYRWLSWKANSNDGSIYAVARDVTEAKEQAESLERSQQALRQAQKMEAVGQLTGGIAHDFNNLLATMVGNLELIRMRLSQGKLDELVGHITGALAATDKAAALTHRLLAFSRKEALNPKLVNVNAVLSDTAELVRRTVGSSITVRTDFSPGIWNTVCDLNQLENAILNLAINSRDAMTAGGELVVATNNVSFDIAAARQKEGLRPGSYVCVSVSDNGEGMSPEVATHVFEPFFTTKPAGQGTGLGLSMVFGFVKQSNGYVELDSKLGKGTTVALYLPMHTSAEEATEATSRPPSVLELHQGRKTVLLVDDETSLRRLLADMLLEMGFEVKEAREAKEAYAVVEHTPDIDLLVCDIGLPGMNGLQLAKSLQAARPGIPSLLITGYAHGVLNTNEQLGDCVQLLDKPFTLDAFTAQVRNLLNC